MKTITLRGVHAAVLALYLLFCREVPGNLGGLGLVLPPLAAALGLTYLTRTRSRRRGSQVALVGLTAALLLVAAAATAQAWSEATVPVQREVVNGRLGPNGANDACLLVWAVLLGAVGGAILATLAGRQDVWSTFGWYVWASLVIATVSYLPTLSGSKDVGYDAFASGSPFRVPFRELGRALVTFLVLMSFVTLRSVRSHRRDRQSDVPQVT